MAPPVHGCRARPSNYSSWSRSPRSSVPYYTSLPRRAAPHAEKAVPSSDRVRRPFLLSLTLFFLLSALLALLFIFIDPSPGTLAFLSSRLSSSAPSFPPPLFPEQQNPAVILTPSESTPHSPPTHLIADATGAEAEDNTTAAQPDASARVESSGNRDPTRADNNSSAPDGAAGDDAEEEAPMQVRWETCRVGRGVSAADYIPCLDNARAIKALREHREHHWPTAPRPRFLMPLPTGYRMPVPWPRIRDTLANYNSFVGVLYCRPCFDQLFKRMRSLDKGFEGLPRRS